MGVGNVIKGAMELGSFFQECELGHCEPLRDAAYYPFSFVIRKFDYHLSCVDDPSD
jgi:hypothetical protein